MGSESKKETEEIYLFFLKKFLLLLSVICPFLFKFFVLGFFNFWSFSCLVMVKW